MHRPASLLLLAVALTLASATACEPAQPDHEDWRDDAYYAVSDTSSDMAAAYAVLRQLERDRVMGNFAQVSLVTAEEHAGKVADRFGAEQQPEADDARQHRVEEALSSAGDLLTATREAVVRRNRSAYPGLASRLTQTRRALDRLATDLGGVRG
ncbi:hypothetical protein [Nocardioides montaniterrae]